MIQITFFHAIKKKTEAKLVNRITLNPTKS